MSSGESLDVAGVAVRALDEPIHLEPYQSDWVAAFLSERSRISDCLGVGPAVIEHIGSTAVAGLSAKPIIDIMIGAKSVLPPETWFEAMSGLGYESLGEAGVPGRWYFRLRTLPSRNAHIEGQVFGCVNDYQPPPTVRTNLRR